MSIERLSINPENEPEKPFKVAIQPVTFEDLVDVGIPQEQIDQLTPDDLKTITQDIVQHFNHDVFPYELKWQVGKLLDDRDKET